MKNKVRVTVCGKEFGLQTDDAPAYLMGLAKKLDRQIDELMAQNPSLSTQSASILAALAAYDEAAKANESIDNIRTQITEYVDEAGQARIERDDALRERDAALKEAEYLRTKLSCYETADKINKNKG